MDDLNDLYCRTMIAQRQAARRGFVETAAALGSIARILAQQADIDPALVQKFSSRLIEPRQSAPPS